MPIDVEIEKCSDCSGTGSCSRCLSSGFVLTNGEYVECTWCHWETYGVCPKCKGKGEIKHLSRVDEDNFINLDFSQDKEEDFEIDI